MQLSLVRITIESKGRETIFCYNNKIKSVQSAYTIWFEVFISKKIKNTKKIMKQNEKECTQREWEGSIATNWISRKTKSHATKSNKSGDLIYSFMHTLTSLQAELMCILRCLSLSHCHSSCTFCEDAYVSLSPSLSFGFETFICVKSFCYTFFVYLCLRTHTFARLCVFIAI